MTQMTIALLLLAVFSPYAFSQKTENKAYLQKIRQATPKTLPQTPVSKTQTTDAQDERLKGKVKSVIEESESLTGVAKPFGRKMSSIDDFNEQGNYLRRVYFDYQGRPSEVNVYGFIDGVRASLSNSIKYGDELYATFPGDKKKTAEKPKADPRYEYLYEYKYADGKLTEMQMIINTGEKGMRYVYKHNGNQLEWFAYTDDDELNQKFLHTFDDKGNEIGRTSFNVRQAEHTINGKYRFRYEAFDKQGNWTKRIYSEVEMENGKEVYRPLAIEYRTITYY